MRAIQMMSPLAFILAAVVQIHHAISKYANDKFKLNSTESRNSPNPNVHSVALAK